MAYVVIAIVMALYKYGLYSYGAGVAWARACGPRAPTHFGDAGGSATADGVGDAGGSAIADGVGPDDEVCPYSLQK